MVDLLHREHYDSLPWEALLNAIKEQRTLHSQELDLLDEASTKAAYAHGLVDREDAEDHITRLHDAERERAWYN